MMDYDFKWTRKTVTRSPAACDANRARSIQFGPEVLQEAAEETDALMNYFLFFPRSFFFFFLHLPTLSHSLAATFGSAGASSAILGIFANL